MGSLFGGNAPPKAPKFKINQGVFTNDQPENQQLQNLNGALQQVNGMTAPMATAATSQAAQAGNTMLGPTSLANTAQVAPVVNAQAGQVNNTALANAAQLNPIQANQSRAQNEQLINTLAQQASGRGPSLALEQTAAQRDQNNAAAQALMNSTTGGNPSLNQRSLLNQLASTNQNAASQGVQARTAEINNAIGNLGNTINNQAGMDVNVAAQNAALRQQAGLANAGALNTTNLTNAGFNQGANLANASQANQLAALRGQLGEQTNLTNAGALNTANLTQAQLLQAIQQQNAAQAQQTNLANAANQQQTGLANQASQLTTTGQQFGQETNIQNLINQINQSNRQSQEAGQALGVQQQTGLAGAQAQNNQATNQGIGGIIGGLAQGAVAGAALASDERLKKNIKPADADLQKFLDALSPEAYKYKDQDYSAGQKFGVMAQDLEKSKVGKQMVFTNTDGYKYVKTGPEEIAKLFAIAGHLNKKIKAMGAK